MQCHLYFFRPWKNRMYEEIGSQRGFSKSFSFEFSIPCKNVQRSLKMLFEYMFQSYSKSVKTKSYYLSMRCAFDCIALVSFSEKIIFQYREVSIRNSAHMQPCRSWHCLIQNHENIFSFSSVIESSSRVCDRLWMTILLSFVFLIYLSLSGTPISLYRVLKIEYE